MNNINPTIANNNNNNKEEACLFRSCLLQSNFNHSMHFSKHDKDKRKHYTVPCSDKRNSNKAEKSGEKKKWHGKLEALTPYQTQQTFSRWKELAFLWTQAMTHHQMRLENESLTA
mmetsp:Transcript_2566/g.3721  ORF Transcript_2566/g.3721 Transcript_2566/m.3721 type:complete len:115 (+) Transcript_2566:92-436(+)